MSGTRMLPTDHLVPAKHAGTRRGSELDAIAWAENDAALTNAYEQERTRRSRELHDDIAQRIALLSIDSELTSMRERARLVHARLQVSSKTGEGTSVEARLPIRPGL
jgi:signal transduction histidine kinase